MNGGLYRSIPWLTPHVNCDKSGYLAYFKLISLSHLVFSENWKLQWPQNSLAHFLPVTPLFYANIFWGNHPTCSILLEPPAN